MAALPHCTAHQCENEYKRLVVPSLIFEDSDDNVRDPLYAYDTVTVCSSDGVRVCSH